MKRLLALLLCMMLTLPALAKAAPTYTEGDVDSTIQGKAILFEGTGNMLIVPSSSNPIPVSNTPSGTQDINLTQIGGATVDVGSGTGGSATLRIIPDTASAIQCNAGTNLNTSSLALDTSVDGIEGLITTLDAVVDTISSAIADLVLGLVGPANPTDFDSYTSVAINLTTGANQVLVSSAANKQIWVYSVSLLCGDADGQTFSFQDEDDTQLNGIQEVSQYGGLVRPGSGNFNMPIWKLGTDKDLEIDITGGDCDGDLQYAIVDVS